MVAKRCSEGRNSRMLVNKENTGLKNLEVLQHRFHAWKLQADASGWYR